MNNDLVYLNQLQQAGMIHPGEYLNQLGMMYANEPESFSQEEVDFVEKQFKAADIPFGRDMEIAEGSITSVANQFISGFAEGFTTFGWAEEADTAAERIAANMGHLAGFAPDLIAAFWTMGASTTLTAAKLTAKGAVKSSKNAIVRASAGTTLDDIATGAINAADAKKILSSTSTTSQILSGAAILGGRAAGGLSRGAKKIQTTLSELARKSEKLGPLKLSKKIMNKEGRPYYMLRSLPMRAADVILDAGKKGLKAANIDGGIIYDSWVMRNTLGSKAARNMTEEGLRLGLALGASSWKEGPEEMGRAAFHGAIAGAFFGGVGEYVKIGRLFRKSAQLSNEGLENAARKLILEARKKVKNRSRKINNQTLSRKMNEMKKALKDVKQSTIGLNNEQALDMWAKGITGASFTGIQATMNDLPLPDQLYEYALGFFFGASGRSHKDKEYYGYLFGEKTAIKPSNSLEYDLYNRKKSQEWNELDPSTQKRIERHFEELYEQQVNQQAFIAGNVSHTIRELLKENPELAEKVLEQAQRKQGDKDPDVIEFEKKAQKEGKKVLEAAREESLKHNAETNRKKIHEEAKRIEEEKEFRTQEMVESDVNKEIDRRVEPTTDSDGNVKKWKSKVKYGRQMTEEALYKKARKDGREGTNSYKDLLKKYGKQVAQIYTLERKRVESVKKKSVGELKRAESWEIELEAARAELKQLAELFKENADGINFTFESLDALKKTLEDMEAGEGQYNQAALEVLTDSIFKKYELFDPSTKEWLISREEVKINLKRLVYDAEFNFEKFKELFEGDFPNITMDKVMERSFKEFLKTEQHYVKEFGPIIRTNIKRNGKPEGDAEIIVEGVPEINGRDQSNYRPANKVNQMFALPGENVRKIIEKIWHFEKKGKKGAEFYENDLSNPLDVLISAISGKKHVSEHFMFTNRELMDLTRKSLPEGWYLFGGSKDSGTLIIQRYPYQTKEKGKEDFISEKDLKDLDTFFDKKGIKVEKGLERERTANIMWELVENGLITKNEKGISVASIKEGFETYSKSYEKTGYGSVIKWNKYQTLAQGNEIPMNPLVFRKGAKNAIEDMDGEFFRGVLVEDLPSSILGKGDVIKSNQSGTDGVIYTRDDVINAKFDDFGIPLENGFYKPVGFVKARDGKGLIRMKAGGFSAGEKLNKWMHANNVHYVIYDSAVKVGLNRPVLGEKDFGYNAKTGEWTSKELGLDDIIRIRPEEIHINMGVKEEARKVKRIAMIKGMYDKANQTQFTPQHREAIDLLRDKSVSGDKRTTNKFQKQLRLNKDFDYEWLDVDKLDMRVITSTLAENPTSEASRKIMKRILQSTKEESMNIKENWEIDLEEGGRNQDLSDILPAMDYLPIGYLWKTFKPFAEKAARNYLVARATKMKQDYGFYQKLGAYDAEIRSLNNGKGIRDNEFMLANGHRKDKIDVDGKEMNLETAYNEWLRLTTGIEQNKKRKVQTTKTLETIQKMEEKLKVYDNALTYALTRAPVSGNGGVRVLRFAGFLKRKGYSVHTNELNDYYLGGADKDGDAVHAIQRFGSKTDMVEGRPSNLRKLLSDKEFILEQIEYFESNIKEYPKEGGGPYNVFMQYLKEYQAKLVDIDVKIRIEESTTSESRDVDSVIKEGYKKVQNELEMDPNKPGIVSNIKDPKVLKDIFGVEEKTFKTPEEKLASIFDPIQRIDVAKNAALGNSNMGQVVNAYTRMQWLYDTIQTGGSKSVIDGKNLYDLGDWAATKGTKNYKGKKIPPRVKLEGEYTNFYVSIKEGLDFMTIVKDGYNGINVSADSADYASTNHAGPSTTKAFHKYFDIYGTNKKTGKTELVKDAAEKMLFHSMFSTSKTKGFAGLSAVKDFHDSLFGSKRSSTSAQSARKIAENYLEGGADARRGHDRRSHMNTGNFYTGLAEVFAEIDIDINPFNHYSRVKIYQLASAIAKQNDLNPLYRELEIYFPYTSIYTTKELDRLYGVKENKDGKKIALKGAKLKKSDEIFWDATTDMISMSYALSKSQALINELVAGGVPPSEAHRIIKEVMRETFAIKQDSKERADRIKKEGLGSKTDFDKILGGKPDSVDIQRLIATSKKKWLTSFKDLLKWEKDSEQGQLAEGVFDAWAMANPILRRGNNEAAKLQQEKWIAELEKINEVINDTIVKEGPGYDKKIKLSQYRELDYLDSNGEVAKSRPQDLNTLYGMRGKLINKMRPRVDHLLKSSVINNTNRKEYFGFLQNVLDRSNAMPLSTTSKELPGIAKSLSRIKAIEQIVEEAKKPARKKKRNTPEKKQIEVEEEVLDNIIVEGEPIEPSKPSKPTKTPKPKPVVEEDLPGKPKKTKKGEIPELPKFKEWRMQELIEKFGFSAVTNKGELELRKLIKFVRANPELAEVLEVEFSSAMEAFKGYRQTFGRMTTNDLEMFNSYLNLRYFDRGNIVRKVEGLVNIVKNEDARIQFGGKKDGFDSVNREKVFDGLKTTTIRTAEWMKKNWFEPGKSEMVVKIGNDYYNVIDRGLGKFDKKDLANTIKTEAWEVDKDGNPMLKYKQERDYINSGKEMHVLEFKKVPPRLGNWSNLSLFKRVAEDLIPFEKRLQFIPDAKIIGDDGMLKTYAIEVPTSTLEMVRNTADSFHRISAAYNEYMEKRLSGLFDFIDTDDKQVMKDFETVFDAVTWEKTKRIKTKSRRRKKKNSERTFLKKIMEGKSKEYVEEMYNKSQENLKELGNKKYHLVGIGKNGKDKTVTLKEFKKMIDETITEYLTDVNQRLVQSKVTDKKNPFKVILQRNGFKNEYTNNAFDIKENKDSKWVNGLNEMFLGKDGFIIDKKVNSVYKGIEFPRETTQEMVDNLPSINDVLYFKYHLEMKEASQRQLKDNASNSDKKKFIQEYQKNNPLGVHKVGEFVNTKTNRSDNYFPQLGQFDTKAKRDLLDVWMNEIIDIAGTVTAKELPADLRDKYFNGQIKLEEARKDYQMRVKEELEMRKGSSIMNENLDNYNSVTELLHSRKKSFAGDYTAGNLKSRSEAFLPFWRTDMSAIESYSGAISKNFFDLNAGFRMNTHIKHFDKTRPFGEFTDNWSSYIKDAASNMLGYASLRSLDLHGIKKGERELLGKFIENDLDRHKVNKNWKILQGHQKRFLQDVADHIEPDRIDRRILENKYPKNKQAIERALHKLRMRNAKELADPKNVDKIGKFKLAYTLVSDEAWTGMAMRFEDAFGVKPWFTKDIPTTNLRNRRLLLSKKLQAFSAWEAKFELISLLSHPKTTITNFLGGGQNLYADVGAMNIYRATKFGGEDYLLNQVGMKNKQFEGIDAKGRKVMKTIKTYEDILDWIESTGALEGMFITEIGLDSTLRKGKASKFTTDVARRFFSKNKGNIGKMNKTEWDKAMDLTLLELRRELGVGQGVFKVGASFMSWSEYQLRTRSFLAHYLNARELLKTGMEHSPLDFIEWNDPELTQRAIKGVESSQFMYHAAHRSNYSQTSMGRVMTRFHPYAWNSVRRRFGPKEGVYKVAKAAGWEKELYATEKGRRQFTMDLMSMSLSYIFTASIFEYALSPPMSWMQDTAQWLFGDERERERAFFSMYPHPALAPLSIVTPPIARTVLAPANAILSGDLTKFKQFYGYSYLPFGRMIRDVKRTIDSPAMAVDFMTGLPLHKIHSMRRDQIEANTPPEEEIEE